MAKNLGLKAQMTMDGEATSGVVFIAPNPAGVDYVAKSKDYVLVMHFSESFKDRMRNLKINDDVVD